MKNERGQRSVLRPEMGGNLIRPICATYQTRAQIRDPCFHPATVEDFSEASTLLVHWISAARAASGISNLKVPATVALSPKHGGHRCVMNMRTWRSLPSGPSTRHHPPECPSTSLLRLQVHAYHGFQDLMLLYSSCN